MSGLELDIDLDLSPIFSAQDTVSLIPLYSTVTFVSDGILSHAAAAGFRNGAERFMRRMNGRLRPSSHMMKGKSGQDMPELLSRLDAVIGTYPDVCIAYVGGHNDGLKSSAWESEFPNWTAPLDYLLANLRPSARLVVMTTIRSAVFNETLGGDWAAIVNAAQIEYVEELQSIHGTNKVILVDSFAGFDPLTMTPASDTGRVHPDERGGNYLENVLFDVLDPLVEPATLLEILQDRAAKPWRSAGYNAHYALLGTSGTLTTSGGGQAPTGQVANNNRVTNFLINSSALGVVASKDTAGEPDYHEQLIAANGTPSAANLIRFDKTGSQAQASAVPGCYIGLRAGITIDDGAGDAPDGLENLGLVLSSVGAYGTSGAPGTGHTGYIGQVIEGALECNGPAAGADSGFSVNPQINVRLGATNLDVQIRVSHLDLFLTELDERGPMRYVAGDGIAPANERLRVTGTGVNMTTMQITAATVGTVRLEAGRWGGGNADWATAFTRVVKINGVVVSGALASSWTHSLTGLVSPGDTVSYELTGENSLGGETRTLTFTVV